MQLELPAHEKFRDLIDTYNQTGNPDLDSAISCLHDLPVRGLRERLDTAVANASPICLVPDARHKSPTASALHSRRRLDLDKYLIRAVG